MSGYPLVSVVIPFYDGRAFLTETLRSFCEQEYQLWECLVIDDYSPVSGEDICRSMNDKRIRYIKNDGSAGMANARNKGCSIAKGEFIALCDQDDISLPQRLSKQVEILKKNEALLLVGSWRQNFGENNHEVHYVTDDELIKMRLMGNSQFANPSVMFRSALISQMNMRFDQNMAPSDDYDFICRVSLRGELTNIPEVLLLYRVHDKQVSTQKSKEMETLAYKIRKTYILERLSPWISHGLDIRTMVDIFSLKGCADYSSKEIVTLFSSYVQLNAIHPLWTDVYWKAFLGERLLLVVKFLELSRIQKLKIMVEHKSFIMAFLYNGMIRNRLKFTIKSIW